MAPGEQLMLAGRFADRSLGTYLNEWQLGTLHVECGGCRMRVPSLLGHGHGNLGVAAAGALGARLHGKGEHEAVAGLRVGGYDESGAHRAFLPQRKILRACIA